MSIVDNHPATIPPLDTLHTPTSAFEKTVLREFLGEEADMADTIDHLKELLAHLQCSLSNISPATLFNARRALVSLTNLTKAMESRS